MVGINTNIEEGVIITSPLPSSNNISSDEICGGGSPHNYDAAADPSTIAAAATSPTAAAVGASVAQSSTVEIMNNNDIDGMPLTPGMAEAISYGAEPKETRRVEIMDDDDTAPVPPAALQDSFNNAEDDVSDAAGKSNKQIHKLKISNEGEDEGPTHPMEYEDNYDDGDAIAKKKAKEEINNNQRTAEPDDLESVYDVPDMERDTFVRGVINTGDGTNNRRGLEDFEARARTDDNNNNTVRNDEEEGGIINNEVSDEDEGDAENVPLGDRSTVHIPEAFLVDDISVYDDRTLYDATQILPWWKQRRTRVLLGVMFVLLAAMAIALGVTLSSNNTNENNPVVQNVLILSSDAPSSSLVPTSSPTTPTPTSSPTTCVHKITENAQVIDLQIGSPYQPKVAIDGRNMVVVAKDGKYINEEDDDDYYYGGGYDGPVFITFYSLDDEKWQTIQTPIGLENMGSFYEVALSGTTAFVGFGEANNDQDIVLVYEQNQFGAWKKVENPFIHDGNATQSWFGSSVEIDGDLACVKYGWNINLYHREGNNKWVKFDTVDDGYECSISDDTIAIHDWLTDSTQLYKYDQDLKEVTPIQEPITPCGIFPKDLSNNYLVCWDTDEYGALIYSRDDKNQTFIFHQQLNITGPSDNALSLDNDLLVVGGGDNHTHIFSLQNDEWVETITLDRVFNDYQLSGRTLIATSEENEVYSFNIQDCMQAMPTQTPSISVTPSLTPSSRPSMILSLSPSLVPSSSVSPTSYWSTLSWRQQGLAIAGDSAGDVAGSSVAISGDGRTLVVGAHGYIDDPGTHDRPGYVKVYYKQFDLSGWKWKLAETFTGKEVGDRFGSSVSMSEDGKTIAIGAPNNGPGYTRVYIREDDKWTQLGEDIEGEALGDRSGGSVSLSSDGKTVAIGAVSNDDNGDYSGHVRVYTVDEGDGDGDSSNVASWQQLGQDIDGEAAGDYSGESVSLSANGRTVAIGAQWNDGGGGDSGHMRVYSLVGDDWDQIGQDIDGENENDWFGTSASLSSDGRMVAVGAPRNGDNGDGAGKVKVYRLDSSDSDDKWVQIGQDMNGEAAGENAGTSVSLSRDGKTLAIGADQYFINDSPGYVQVYRLFGSDDSWSWIQVGKDINGVNAGDHAGYSVALSSDGNVVVVGSPVFYDDNGENSGHVKVFGIDIEDVMTTPACVDTPNYLDIYRGTCAEYELPGNENWCGGYGNDGEAGKTPNENCCICINALADDENNRF